mmetsp:Transcript_3349/g.6407  ORF Transcript_3349/g.6407 Transcript_3349/m.6407 type:complete len:140 (-) Transcript_3349:5641-6060(-)
MPCNCVLLCFFLVFQNFFSFFFVADGPRVHTEKYLLPTLSPRARRPLPVPFISSFFFCVVEKKKAHSFKPHDSGQDRPSHRISQFATAFTSLALVVGWIFSHAIHRTAESPLFILHIVFYLFYAAGLLSCPGCCLTLCG